ALRPFRALPGIWPGPSRGPILGGVSYRRARRVRPHVSAVPSSKRVTRALPIACTLLLVLAHLLWAAPGDLDPSFNGGTVPTPFSSASDDEAFAVAIQPDGKIVVAGFSTANGSADFALARYNVDGSLDSTFGNGGKVLTDFTSGSDDEAH